MNAEPMNTEPERQTTTAARSAVCFAIPMYGDSVTGQFLRSWTETIMLLKEKGIEASILQIPGDQFIAKARNRLLTDFLRECPDYDSLFFIDDDVDWPARKVLEFLQRPEGIVAGAYPMKQKGTDFPVTFECNADTGELIERDGLLKTMLIPGGFMRIKRWVLERLIEPPTRVFKDTMPDGTTKRFYGVFESGIDPNPAAEGDVPYWWGEDYVFSRKCQNLGIEIWVDPDIKFGHSGRKRWEDSVSNHMDYYRLKAKMAAEKNPKKQSDLRLRAALLTAEAMK